jgi:hypothetical protein
MDETRTDYRNAQQASRGTIDIEADQADFGVRGCTDRDSVCAADENPLRADRLDRYRLRDRYGTEAARIQNIDLSTTVARVAAGRGRTCSEPKSLSPAPSLSGNRFQCWAVLASSSLASRFAGSFAKRERRPLPESNRTRTEPRTNLRSRSFRSSPLRRTSLIERRSAIGNGSGGGARFAPLARGVEHLPLRFDRQSGRG